MPAAIDLLFDWRPMNTVQAGDPVMLRTLDGMVAGLWRDGHWRIGKGRTLIGYPSAWTPIHAPVASERGMT